MKGIAYGVGVGPGDPELMTLKAVRLIRETDVIAVPGTDGRRSAAYQIAVRAVPELAEKELVSVELPMVKDRSLLEQARRRAAERIAAYLDQGRNVVWLTLGDPTVYSTFGYLQRILEAEGYGVELVSGVSSVCAAAARLHLPLAEWDEPLHVLPAIHRTGTGLDEAGTCVLMKSGRSMAEVKDLLRESGRTVLAVENCGMASERVYRGVEEIPDEAGYFTLIIAKEAGRDRTKRPDDR